MALLSLRRDPTVSGIGGWLALLAFGLCARLLYNVILFASDVGSYDEAWAAAPDARPALAAMAGATALHMAANLWAISALFQKKRSFRTAFVALWIMAVVDPLSGQLLGFDMHEILRALGAAVLLGLWFLYLCLSVRVRNTLVN